MNLRISWILVSFKVETMREVSKKQQEANQNNAKKGGVKTTAGKEVVRYNATKHGIFSARNILPGESSRTFYKLEKEIKKDLAPQGAMEEILVEKIISIVWRMRRLLQVEAAIDQNEKFQEYWASIYDEHYYPCNIGQMKTMNRYESMLDRALYKALAKLREMQKTRQEDGFDL